MTNRYRITGQGPVFSATGDAKNPCAAVASPLSPVSPLKMKSTMKLCSRSNSFTFNTSDTGDVVGKATGFGVGETTNFRGSTP
jgi:hypothetical protein